MDLAGETAARAAQGLTSSTTSTRRADQALRRCLVLVFHSFAHSLKRVPAVERYGHRPHAGARGRWWSPPRLGDPSALCGKSGSRGAPPRCCRHRASVEPRQQRPPASRDAVISHVGRPCARPGVPARPEGLLGSGPARTAGVIEACYALNLVGPLRAGLPSVLSPGKGLGHRRRLPRDTRRRTQPATLDSRSCPGHRRTGRPVRPSCGTASYHDGPRSRRSSVATSAPRRPRGPLGRLFLRIPGRGGPGRTPPASGRQRHPAERPGSGQQVRHE